MILVTMAGVITSTIRDGSANKWAALSVMLPGTLLLMGVILLPVAIGLPLARRDGLLAGLVVVAADFVLVDWILDPAYGLVLLASNPTIVTLVSVIPAVFLLVVSPIWVLACGSTRGRVLGLLLPVFVALVSVEIISGSVRPYYLHWLTRAIESAQFLTALALAAVTYHWIGHQGRLTNISHGRGTLTDDTATVTGGSVLSIS